MRRIIFFGIILMFIISGCIKPSTRLGCCLKANATDPGNTGCVLYNISDPDEDPLDLISDTVSCNTTTGCNVSWKGDWILIPVCTEEDMVQCINPDCTAMICGDFEFKPNIAPSFTSMDNPEEAYPAGSDEEKEAANFYQAQCRYLSMDSKFNNVMKNSNSQINVFRIGVGGSFDEFDQYRYYFPMSDKFCDITPSLSGLEDVEKVDRYMNYLTSSKESYDPITEITENCLIDGGDYTTSPSPFTFTESSLLETSRIEEIPLIINYLTKTPDLTTYKFSHYARIALGRAFDPIGDVFKKIDEGFYRRELSIAHAETIYDMGDTGSTRASFECDSSTSDCYSGYCDIDTYNRGVFVSTVNDQDVVTDCFKTKDEFGLDIVACAPTTGVTLGSSGNPPDFDYSHVLTIPAHLWKEVSDGTDAYKYDEAQQEYADGDHIYRWYKWVDMTTMYRPHGTWRSPKNHTNASYVTFTREEKDTCEHDYGDNDDDDTVWCSYMTEFDYAPVVGGSTFFGKGDNGEAVIYPSNPNKAIIGYGLPSDGNDAAAWLLVENCNMQSGSDYVTVTMNLSAADPWQELGYAFTPYYSKRVAAFLNQGNFELDDCGKKAQFDDIAIGSLPWVTAFGKEKKGTGGDSNGKGGEEVGYFVSATHAYAMKERNIYDEEMIGSTYDLNSCNIRRAAAHNKFIFYNVAVSQYVTLFLYTPGSGAIGDCVVDESTYLPKVRTFGWCEPCTTSTLAYQEITALDIPYMPYIGVNVEEELSRFNESLCELDYSAQNMSCFNEHITDLDDYGGPFGNISSPRTVPEASILKERMGNYMKSGIMPVIDLSDDSNWVVPEGFNEYDFERLFGNMGAVVVIVDHIEDEEEGFEKLEQIINRSNTLKAKCYGCLNAIHIDAPADNESFEQTMDSVLFDPRALFSIDMITFDYSITDHSSVAAGETGYINKSKAILNDIASYGTIALQKRDKPSMVVGLTVDDTDPLWNNNFESLFATMFTEQETFVTSGIIGVIYSPARSPYGDGLLIDMGGVTAAKVEKFCAFQEGVYLTTTIPPTASFRKVLTVNETNCTLCTSLEIALGTCGSQTCENGGQCILPQYADPSVYKCADGIVLEPCQLCNETPGNYYCNRTYANGTIESFDGPMSEIDSDIYMDIIGGIPKPYKCCLTLPLASEDTAEPPKYSYVKESQQSPISRPIVFSKEGPEVDCGFGNSASALGDVSEFCNIKQSPVREYDIECTIS